MLAYLGDTKLKKEFVREIKSAPNGQLLSYLNQQLDKKTDECIIWPYTIVAGYGQIRYKGKKERVHRLALKLSVGEPPIDKQFALHRPLACHNTLCFNPKHLYWGSAKQNSADRAIDGTQARGEMQGASKLRENQIVNIREDNRKLLSIANDYGVTRQAIWAVKNSKSWSWV